MRKRLAFLCALFLITGMVACQANMDRSPDSSEEEIKSAIESQSKAFMDAFEARDTTAYEDLYAESAWTMPQFSEPAKGIDAVKGFFKQGWSMGYTRLELEHHDIFTHGDGAVEVGSYTLYSGEEVTDEGSYMVYWKKSGDGWKLYRDIFNTDMPPPQQEEK